MGKITPEEMERWNNSIRLSMEYAAELKSRREAEALAKERELEEQEALDYQRAQKEFGLIPE